MELIVFPGVESLVGTYIQNLLTARGRTTAVATKLPTDTRTGPGNTEHVRIQVIGGIRAGLVIKDATVLLEAYADTEAAAAELAELVGAILYGAQYDSASGIYLVEQTATPQNLPDPRTGMSRYTQTATVRLRGTAA
jgi:hypothetical protein